MRINETHFILCFPLPWKPCFQKAVCLINERAPGVVQPLLQEKKYIHTYIHKESKLIKAALKQWILSSHFTWRWVNNGTTEISFMQRSRVCWEVSMWQFAADACLEEPFISVTHAHYYTQLPQQHDSTSAFHIAHSSPWYFRHRNNPYLGLSTVCLLKQFVLPRAHRSGVGKLQNLFPLLIKRTAN